MRRAVSVSGAAFALFCIVLILYVLPASAQDDGIPPGTPANGVDTSNTNAPPDVILVAADDCTVSRGASITLEDGDGTQATFTDGAKGITITDQNGRPKIEGPPGDFVGDDSHVTFPSDDTSFDTDGDYSVVSSTGITGCRGGSTTQDGTTPGQNQYAPGPDSECPGAQVVSTTTGTGPKQSPPFRISGERFRVTIVNEATSQDPSLSGVSVFVNEANGNPVTTFSQEGPGTDSSIINAGPGDFFIETNPANASYTIVVEDCVDTQGNPPANSGGDVNNPKGMVPGTESPKVPFTGGPPYVAVGALVLLSVALLAGGVILRP
ncbi:MAG TPA: hypothetical protein VFI90_13890 [Rubrobacter sp.]|nr:hypothetical protein [Rubrobacter sp.]